MKKYLFLLIAIFCEFGIVSAQNNLDSLSVKFTERLIDNPSQLVYLQTSKGIYETGEDLFFKAYILDAYTFGLPDSLSEVDKTLYLQMLTDKDSVVWREKYPIVSGVATGQVYVSEKLTAGDYQLEGYTRRSFFNDSIWMLPARKIRIVDNIAQSIASSAARSQSEKSIEASPLKFEMFAEGGNLVRGLSSRLAFKATDGKGNPMAFDGMLYEGDRAMCEIKSTHDGMGAIWFTPENGKTYRVELTNGGSYPLPAIQDEGMVLSLESQDPDKLNFIVSQSDNIPDGKIYIVGQMRGAVCCIATGTLKQRMKISIPTANFPYQGIAEFTLVDQNMEPVAERLVALHPDKKLNITLTPDQKSYATRTKATINIRVTDQAGMPVKANLGLSIYDKAYVNADDAINIMTHCYLSSQIRGKIYNPAYYFDQTNADRAEALDLLLLTQGWRRYVWNAANAVPRDKQFIVDHIVGRQMLASRKTKKDKVDNAMQLIQVSAASGSSKFIWTDSLGRFTVDPAMMNELRGGYIYLKSMLGAEFKPVIKIDDCFSIIDSVRKTKPNFYPTADPTQHQIDWVVSGTLSLNDSTQLIDAVRVIGKGHGVSRDKFMGHLDSLAHIYTGGPWVCTCGDPLGGYINDYNGYNHHPLGLHTSDYKGPRLAPLVGHRYRAIRYEPNSDGQWYVTDVKEITYTGTELSEAELLRASNIWRAKGYYAAREFYQADAVDVQLSTPDARNTLLWQPSVTTDSKGEASVSFYCSDLNTVFTGVAEGVDGLGLLGNGECEFRVLKKAIH
ncbi:MAG: hypothetical protein RSD89_03805 [Mucinivorans sp.]